MKKVKKVYAVISDRDICGDIPSVLMGRTYDIQTIYDYACLAVFEKRRAALNWKKAAKNEKGYKVVSAILTIRT